MKLYHKVAAAAVVVVVSVLYRRHDMFGNHLYIHGDLLWVIRSATSAKAVVLCERPLSKGFFFLPILYVSINENTTV